MKKILIVDDEVDVIELVFYYFKVKGYLVEVINNFNNSFGIVCIFLFDLVIFDVMMFDLNGV